MEATQDYYSDSLMYEFRTRDVYEDLSNNKEMFDFSNYGTKSKYYDNSNKFWLNGGWNSWCWNWGICWIKAKDVFIFDKW